MFAIIEKRGYWPRTEKTSKQNKMVLSDTYCWDAHELPWIYSGCL